MFIRRYWPSLAVALACCAIAAGLLTASLMGKWPSDSDGPLWVHLAGLLMVATIWGLRTHLKGQGSQGRPRLVWVAGLFSLGISAYISLVGYYTGSTLCWVFGAINGLLAFSNFAMWVRMSAAEASGPRAWLLRGLELLRSYLADEPASFEAREHVGSGAGRDDEGCP